MEQIITPEMIGWKPLTDISDIKHDDFFPFIAFREKISDNWTVKLYNGSSYWDRVTQKAIDYNDFKKNWIETFYHFPTEPMFWLDACTEREVSLVCQVYAEIFNRQVHKQPESRFAIDTIPSLSHAIERMENKLFNKSGKWTKDEWGKVDPDMTMDLENLYNRLKNLQGKS